MQNEIRKNKIKKGRLLLAASGIAVLFVILYMAGAAFSVSKEELEEETVSVLRSLYEEQLESFADTPDRMLTHSVTIEFGNVGRDVAEHITGKECNGIRNLHILSTHKKDNNAAAPEVRIAADGTPLQSEVLEPWLETDLWADFSAFITQLQMETTDLQKEKPHAEIRIEEETDKVIRDLQYGSYKAVLSTHKKGKQLDLELKMELDGEKFIIQGNGADSGQKFSGVFTLIAKERGIDNLRFEVEQLDLKKWKQGYIKGTFVVPVQEKNIISGKDVWKELSGFAWNETEWVFSMNSDKNERRVKLTAIVSEEIAMAVSVVTEAEETNLK